MGFILQSITNIFKPPQTDSTNGVDQSDAPEKAKKGKVHENNDIHKAERNKAAESELQETQLDDSTDGSDVPSGWLRFTERKQELNGQLQAIQEAEIKIDKIKSEAVRIAADDSLGKTEKEAKLEELEKQYKEIQVKIQAMLVQNQIDETNKIIDSEIQASFEYGDFD